MRRSTSYPGEGRGPVRRSRSGPVFAGLRLVVWLMLALGLGAPAFAQTFPAFSGLVVDAANVMPEPYEAALRAKLEALQQRTGRQFVVATIPDLQGYPIEDYGYRLGRSWGVGLKDADNGAILIVAPAERKVRIEVGRRLEPILTDALSSIIIRDRILPRFKAGDMTGGIDAGADAVIAQLGSPDAQAQAQVQAAAKEFDRTHKRAAAGGGGVPLGLIFWVFVVVFVLLAMRRGRAGGQGAAGPWGQQRYRREGGGSGWIWLWAASEMMNHRGGGGGTSGWGGDGGSGGGSDGSWGGGGFTGGGGGDFGGGGASGDW